MQKDNGGDRETDVRTILKCMSEIGQVLWWACTFQITVECLCYRKT
jgi:hypothetical protein